MRCFTSRKKFQNKFQEFTIFWEMSFMMYLHRWCVGNLDELFIFHEKTGVFCRNIPWTRRCLGIGIHWLAWWRHNYLLDCFWFTQKRHWIPSALELGVQLKAVYKCKPFTTDVILKQPVYYSLNWTFAYQPQCIVLLGDMSFPSRLCLKESEGLAKEQLPLFQPPNALDLRNVLPVSRNQIQWDVTRVSYSESSMVTLSRLR